MNVPYTGGKDSMKTEGTSVLLFYSEHCQVDELHKGLISSEYIVLDRVELDIDLLSPVANHSPDLVILCVHSLEEHVLKGMMELYRNHPLPIIIFAERDAPQIIDQAIRAGVSAYVVNDLQASRLPSIISVAMARFCEFKRLRDELQQTRNKLAGRKTLERAKGLLMSQHRISEQDAYARLRKMSMNKGVSLEVVAQNVVDVISMLDNSDSLS